MKKKSQTPKNQFIEEKFLLHDDKPRQSTGKKKNSKNKLSRNQCQRLQILNFQCD